MRGRGRGRRGSGPRGRIGGGPSLPRERRPRTSEYDTMDVAEIKAMLEFYVDALAKYPRQTPELLRKTTVSVIKTEEEIRQIIALAFTGNLIAAEAVAELCDDLSEINAYANKSKEELKLKSNLRYNPDDIAKMVHDAVIESVLEKQSSQTPLIVVPPAQPVILPAAAPPVVVQPVIIHAPEPAPIVVQPPPPHHRQQIKSIFAHISHFFNPHKHEDEKRENEQQRFLI